MSWSIDSCGRSCLRVVPLGIGLAWLGLAKFGVAFLLISFLASNLPLHPVEGVRLLVVGVARWTEI